MALQVQGHEVGEGQGAEHVVLGDAVLFGVDPHGHGDGDALVAAAGVDDHGQGAAVHAGVGAGRRPGAGAVDEAVAVLALEDGAADLGAPGVLQPLLGDGPVAGELIFERLAHVVDVERASEGVDVAQVQQALVGRGRGGGGGVLLALEQADAVFLQTGDVGVVVRDLDQGPVVPGLGLDADVEVRDPLRKLAVTHACVHQLMGQGDVLLGDRVQDVQPRRGVAADDAEQRGGVDAARAAGVRHGDREHVLDHIAAAKDGTVLRDCSEHLAQPRTGVGDGDGLGTAGRHRELRTDQSYVGVVNLSVHLSILRMK